MKSLSQHLSTYAAYHRDRRNIATHFVGIPLIVLAVCTLASRPALALSGVPLSPAVLLALLGVLFYLRLDRRYGVAMAALLLPGLWAGARFAARPASEWLALGLGLFVVGWAIQFLGHHFEGRKPAFVDDLVGLLVGPLFIVAEASFALGLRPELRGEVERVAGPTRLGPAKASAAEPV